MQIELSKMSKIAGNWGNSTNVKNSNLLNPLESFVLCALATKDVFAWMNPNRLSTTYYQFNINANDLYKLDITRLKQ